MRNNKKFEKLSKCVLCGNDVTGRRKKYCSKECRIKFDRAMCKSPATRKKIKTVNSSQCINNAVIQAMKLHISYGEYMLRFGSKH